MKAAFGEGLRAEAEIKLGLIWSAAGGAEQMGGLGEMGVMD
jgi:hypothetical protein